MITTRSRLPLAWAVCALLVTSVTLPAADGGREIKNLAYKQGNALSDYETERCHLDLYLPAQTNGFATLVWFHGGGLTGGRKDDEFTAKVSRSLVAGRIAVVSVNYRLSPKAKFPAYVEDAAASFAWVRKNIAAYGGDPGKVFIGGHSAGGYLTFMVGLDARYLKPHGLELSSIAGLIPVSGQTMTHYTVCEERGLPKAPVIADEAAPVHYPAKITPPMLVVYADADMATRAEENAYFVSVQKAAGNERVEGLQVANRTHNSIAGNIAQADDPVRLAILEFIKTVTR